MGKLPRCLALAMAASAVLAACGGSSLPPAPVATGATAAATEGAAASREGTAAVVTGVPVEVIEPDRAATATPEVIDATPAEAEATAAAVAILGGTLDVRAITFVTRGRDRAVQVGIDGARSLDAASREPFWLADLLGTEIARRTRGSDHPVRVVEIEGEGGSRVHIERQQPRDVATIAAELAQRATAEGLDATVRGWRFARPAVELRVRLDDRALLEGDLGWLARVQEEGRHEPVRGYDQLAMVEVPGGIVVTALATSGATGSASYGPAASEAMPPPVGVDGPTVVTVTATFSDGLGDDTELERRIDCGEAANAALCADLIAQRAALLAPLIPNTTCAGGISGADVTVGGTVLGVPVERQYDLCYGGVTAAWRALLGAHPVGGAP